MKKSRINITVLIIIFVVTVLLLLLLRWLNIGLYNFMVQYTFWYPAIMSMVWVIGSIFFNLRIEDKQPISITKYPMVSLLVPCYNEGATVRNTVARLNELDYPNFEIICINDGSKDDTIDQLKALIPEFPRLKVVNMVKNAGKANALYHGLLVSNGEILVGVDADSYLAKDALLYMVPHFTNEGGERVGAVTGNPRVRNRSSLLSRLQLCEYASIISMIKRTQRMLGNVMTVSGVCVAFRKKALLDCNLWDRDMITEDIAVTWKLERNFWDVRYEPRALCWMLVPESVKGLFKQRQRWSKGGIEVIQRHWKLLGHIKERRMFPIFFEQICSWVWAVCWLILFILGIIEVIRGGQPMPLYWKSQFLSFVCVIQFTVALLLDRKYDPGLAKYTLWVIWYPILFWYLNALTVLSVLPKTLLIRRKDGFAVWDSPDRGLDDNGNAK